MNSPSDTELFKPRFKNDTRYYQLEDKYFYKGGMGNISAEETRRDLEWLMYTLYDSKDKPKECRSYYDFG